MKKISLGLFVVLLHVSGAIWAQDIQLTEKDSIVKSSWMVGLGYNFVDDSGDEFEVLFDRNTQWNSVAFPSRISIGRYFENGIGLELIGSYNRYKVGKLIDGIDHLKETDYYAVDSRISYDLNKIIGETGWFDPYLGAGLGYTDANDVGRATINGVIGFRTWITERFGLDFNSSGKWALNKANNGSTNQLQHAVGVVYRFKAKKGLSKKGLKKQKLIEQILAENKRIADSTDLANKEVKQLAEKLKKEQEALRLAQAEKDKLDAKKLTREDLQAKINSFGNIHFALNSSSLTKNSESILDKTVELLNENPSVTIKLIAYTDSRGSDKYNMWLSKERAKSSADYIILKGIQADRINANGDGENNLLNKCANGVYCTESEHRVNRRVEITIDKI